MNLSSTKIPANEKILVTGSAGFIGFNVMRRLLQKNAELIGVDNIGDYYDPLLKLARLKASGLIRMEFVELSFIEFIF